jgi:hypothetical protein
VDGDRGFPTRRLLTRQHALRALLLTFSPPPGCGLLACWTPHLGTALQCLASIPGDDYRRINAVPGLGNILWEDLRSACPTAGWHCQCCSDCSEFAFARLSTEPRRTVQQQAKTMHIGVPWNRSTRGAMTGTYVLPLTAADAQPSLPSLSVDSARCMVPNIRTQLHRQHCRISIHRHLSHRQQLSGCCRTIRCPRRAPHRCSSTWQPCRHAAYHEPGPNACH